MVTTDRPTDKPTDKPIAIPLAHACEVTSASDTVCSVSVLLVWPTGPIPISCFVLLRFMIEEGRV